MEEWPAGFGGGQEWGKLVSSILASAIAVSMPRRIRWSAAQHRSFHHIERRKQRGRPMAHVVVGARRNPPRPQGQAGLGVLQGLDLALLIH